MDKKLYTVRGEMVFARDPIWPIKAVQLKPDPLTSFAYAYAQVKHHLDEKVEVHFDLLPLSRASVLYRRKQAAKKHGRGAERNSNGSPLDEFLGAIGITSPNSNANQRPQGVGRLEEISKERSVAKALQTHEQHFQLQVTMRAAAATKQRAKILLQTLLPCFEQWGHENYFKVAGFRLAGRYLGSDMFWNRRLFDRRIDRNIFSQRRRQQIVSATQIGGVVKPATTHCSATNVLRSGSYVPEASKTLLTFNQNADYLMPWGKVKRGDTEKTIGVRLDESYFTWTGGRSRFGKTETALCRLTHLAKTQHGCLFLDPHADALARAKKYLTSESDRIIEVSIARDATASRQAGWNLLSMENCGNEAIDDKAAAITDSFAAAMGWNSSRAPRAISILQNATLTLLELAAHIPDDIAPTIFQLNTLLSNKDWRDAITPILSPSLQSYWHDRFTRFPDDAITPITNLIDRLRSSPSVAALIGSSRSTYDLRRAMDEGKIVLIRLSGAGVTDQLLANLVVFDLLRAVRSRWNLPPDKRQPFHAFMDEVQSYDASIKGLLGAALEEGAKFGLRLHLMNQQPTSLSKRTLNAILTNRSHLMTTNLNAESSRLLANEWNTITPEPIQQLEKYEFITQVTDQGVLSKPFRLRGLSLEEMYGQGATRKEQAKLDVRIDRNSGNQRVAETLEQLDQLDQKIMDHLQQEKQVIPIAKAAGLRFSHSGK